MKTGTLMSLLLKVMLAGCIVVLIAQQRQDEASKQLQSYSPQYTMIHKELRPYVIEFRNMLISNNIKIPWGSQGVVVSFDNDLSPNTLGVAFGMNVDDITIIHINRMRWHLLSHDERTLVMFHELCHDVYNIEHGEMELMMPVKPSFVNVFTVIRVKLELIEYLKNTKHYEESK